MLLRLKIIVSANYKTVQQCTIPMHPLTICILFHQNVNVDTLPSIFSATASELILYVPAAIRALMSLTLSSLTSEASLTAALAVLYNLAVSDHSYLSFSVFLTTMPFSLA